MAIKKLTHTGKQLDDVVQMYVDGKRNIARSTITSIELKAGKIAVGPTGALVYGESVEYTGDLMILPTDKDVIIEAGQFLTKDITIGKINLQEKSVDSAQVVDADDGYYLSNVFIKGKGHDYIGPDYISVDETVYKPGTVNQILMGPKLFVGKQTVLGDTNLAPRNIGKGISLFGIVGTYAGEQVAQVAPDGRSWLICSGISPSGNVYSCYGDGIWTAIDSPGDSAYYSTDGITWFSISMPTNLTWIGMAHGEGRFVALADGNATCAYSDDGMSWKRSECYSALHWSSVTYGGGRFVAVASGTDTAQYSNDGVNWLYATLGKSATWSSVAYGNGMFLAVSKDTGNAAYSYDGEEWSAYSISNYAISKIVSTGDVFICILSNSRKIIYSYDGFAWTEVDVDPENKYSNVTWMDITYGNGKILLMGSVNTIAYSIDCVNWTIYQSGTNANSKISYGNNKFVLSTKNGVYYSSTTLDE